ncbi:MAG: glycosyltransferase [Saprospiraceae bacterium]
MVPQRRILIAPLNWGLGHATRCVPIIRELLRQEQIIFLASDGRALELLRIEFPNLPTFELPAYNVTYRTSNMFWNIGWQLPKIATAIFQERRAIKKLVQENSIDTIISDNRFGAISNQTHNIFLTHQLHLKIPFRPFSMITNWCNHHFIRRFNEVWIPDFAEAESSLAGTLAHPPLKDIPTEYLGVLSRLEQKDRKYLEDTSYLYDLFILLSGPEPQRTYLEEKLIAQLKDTDLTAIIAQGKTERKDNIQLTERIKIVSYLTTKEIEDIAMVSKIMVCRSGYSTIMDLYQLQKEAILIPTPGQTEQEYLAAELKRKGVFFSEPQQGFNLKMALGQSTRFTGFSSGGQTFLSVKLRELL